MEIEVKDYKGNKVVAVKGDIDMYSSPALREALIAYSNMKVSCLLIDFNKVTYIDSSGIATFVEVLKHMKTYGGRLCLFGLPGGVKEIFNFSKLDKVFDICSDMEDAV